ncbi:hypothetical protein K9M79_04385 [Candidatus Woesearchaeota archaeon]|nr:hypothetical protein [Candidatus Woesearchaeota archaeon]
MTLFKKALQFELEGNQMYKDLMERTNNPLLVKVYEYMAAQEYEHYNVIKDYGNKAGLKDENLKDMLRDIADMSKNAEFFKTTMGKFKAKLTLTDDDMNAREDAMGFEQMAYDYYKSQLKDADEKDKKFIEFMMEQENTHYQLIKKAFDYLDDPVSFNAHEENWQFEG